MMFSFRSSCIKEEKTKKSADRHSRNHLTIVTDKKIKPLCKEKKVQYFCIEPLLFFMEQVTRIELALAAWKAVVLPLNHTCKWSGKQDLNPRHLGPKPSALPS